MSDRRGVHLMFAVEDLAAVDRVRGGVPRATWIKALCRGAVAAHDLASGYREGRLGHVESVVGPMPVAGAAACAAVKEGGKAARLARAREVLDGDEGAPLPGVAPRRQGVAAFR